MDNLILKAQAEWNRLEHLRRIAHKNKLDNALIPILSSQRAIEKIFGYRLARGILAEQEGDSDG